MVTILLEKILTLLTGWLNAFTEHATNVLAKLNLIEEDTSNLPDIKTNTDSIVSNTASVITPINNIKSNTDSIKTNTDSIKNDTAVIKNNINTISTNTGTASAFCEDIANNTLDIDNRVVTIGSDTTQLRANSDNITSDVSDIKTYLGYYVANTPVTEDSEGALCNFDTDLTDYLQKAVLTIPSDANGFSSVDVVKCGKNLIDPSKFVSNPTNFIWGYRNEGFLLRANITYTFSFIGTDISSLRLVSVDEQTIYSQASGLQPRTITYTPSNDVLVVFRIWGMGAVASDFQLEVNNTNTSYEPHKYISDTVSLGSTITDGAEIDLLTGLMKVNTTPATYSQISPIAIRTYKGVNNIYADVGDMSVTYRETLKHYLDKNQ